MEDLFSLITSNPILLFLIIGAILNFLQKGKEQDGQKDTKKAPTKKQKKIDEIDWREIFRQESEPEQKQKKTPETYTYSETEQETLQTSVSDIPKPNLLEKYEETKRKKESISPVKQIERSSPIYKDDITAKDKVSLNFANISKQEAIKGVVWSEILGKPRSKGSYRPTMNTNRRKQG